MVKQEFQHPPQRDHVATQLFKPLDLHARKPRFPNTWMAFRSGHLTRVKVFSITVGMG